MKRLFQINDRNGRAVVDDDGEVIYCETKHAAKRLRDGANHDDKSKFHTVAPGPDHHNYKGEVK